MTFTGICPLCSTDIPKSGFASGFAICQCGWTDATPRVKAAQRSERINVAIMSFVSVVAVTGFMHLMSWGSYAFTIPVVQIQQATGTLSNQGFVELAQVCTDLGKFVCAKNAYLGLFEQSKDPLALQKLAHLQILLKDESAALNTYEVYIKSGGKDGEAMIEYAQTLQAANRIDEAMKMFEASITAMPQALPVRATSAIVNQMIKQGQYEQAFERLSTFQDSAGNAKGYMNTELQQLETALGPVKLKKAQREHEKRQPKA